MLPHPALMWVPESEVKFRTYGATPFPTKQLPAIPTAVPSSALPEACFL